MLYTFTFLLAPDPVSPALLKYCIGGLQSLINIDFIQSFSPGTANVWPLTPLDLHQSHNWQVTVGNLASEHLEMLVRPHICILFTAFAQFFWQPVQLQGADLQLRQHFTQHIFSGEMLGCPVTLYDLEYTEAFRDGLCTVLFPTLPPLLEVRCFYIMFISNFD